VAHSELWPWPAEELTEAWPSGSSGAWWLSTTEGKWRGRYGDSNLVLIGAWSATRRWRDGGGALALSGDGVGAI
jgi:hypothetical protein